MSSDPNSSTTARTAAQAVRLMHGSLGIGLMAMAAMAVVLVYLGVAPILGVPDETSILIAYAMSGVAGALVVVALLVVKPRVPERQGSQSVQEYWSTPATAQGALLVWFVLEGAGVLAAVAFLLTGHTAAAFAGGIAIVAYWRIGPGLLART